MIKIIGPEQHTFGNFHIHYTNDILGDKYYTTISLPDDTWTVEGFRSMLPEDVLKEVEKRHGKEEE